MPAVTNSKYLVMAGWNDVPHLDEQTKAELWNQHHHIYAMRGQKDSCSGLWIDFPVDEETLKVKPFDFTGYLAKNMRN